MKIIIKLLSLLAVGTILTISSCSKDDDAKPIEITLKNLELTIDENPTKGQSLGKPEVVTEEQKLTFTISEQSPAGAMEISAATGELKVLNESKFDFETNNKLTAKVTVAVGKVSREGTIIINLNDVDDAVITTENFEVTIPENQEVGTVLGTIVGSSDQGEVSFKLTSETPEGAIAVDANTGNITVKDARKFDFEGGYSENALTAKVEVARGEASKEINVSIYLTDIPNTWKLAGSAGFSGGRSVSNSTTIINGIPYVAFTDDTQGNKTTVMKLNGEVWEVVGSAGMSAGATFSNSMSTTLGVPYVAFSDGANGNKATVMKYESGTWSTVGSAGFSAGSVAGGIKLSFVNSTPYVAFIDGVNSNKANVMKYDGSNWVNVGTYGLSQGTASGIDIDVYNEVPYVAYRDQVNGGKVTVMKYTNDTWTVVGTVGFSSGRANYTQLVVDAGIPYVSYQDVDNGYKLNVMKFNGSQWTTFGNGSPSAGEVLYIDMKLHEGKPYIAYRDQSNDWKATVITQVGNTWTTLGDAGFTSAGALYVNLIFASGGVPHVVYTDQEQNWKLTSMKFIE